MPTGDDLLRWLDSLYKEAIPLINLYDAHAFTFWLVLDVLFVGGVLIHKYYPALLWDAWAPAVQLRTPLAHTEFTTDPVRSMAHVTKGLYLGDPDRPVHTFCAFAVPNWVPGTGCRCTVQPPLRLTEAGLRMFGLDGDNGWGHLLSLGFTVRLDLSKVVFVPPPPTVTGRAGPGYLAKAVDPGATVELLTTLERLLLFLFGSSS